MKKLYILISDGGDGSYYLNYTFNDQLIESLQDLYDDDKMDYDNGIGIDGDGFNYSVLNVPDECTAESMGISVLPDNYAERFKE